MMQQPADAPAASSSEAREGKIVEGAVAAEGRREGSSELDLHLLL